MPVVIFTTRIEEGLDTLAAGAKVRLVRLLWRDWGNSGDATRFGACE